MKNIVPLIIILTIVALAVLYIIKEKKSGAKCIGCPNSKTCRGSCNKD